MNTLNPTRTNISNKSVRQDWPIVSLLFFLTGIAGIPAIFLIAIVALGPGAIEGVSEMVSHLHFETPAAIFVHGGSGILFFITMPMQFSSKLRAKHLRWHKTAGKIAIVSAYVMALSGIWMHNVLTPESQGVRYLLLIVTSLAICIGFTIALFHAIRRNIQSHRVWMARSVAIMLAAVTPLFVDIAIMALFSQFEHIMAWLTAFQYDYGRLVGMIINLAIVEFAMNKKASV